MILLKLEQCILRDQILPEPNHHALCVAMVRVKTPARATVRRMCAQKLDVGQGTDSQIKTHLLLKIQLF